MPIKELPDPVDIIKQDMQRAMDALSQVIATLDTVTGKRTIYRPLAPADEPLKELARQMETFVIKSDEELMEAARRFVSYDLKLFFKSG